MPGEGGGTPELAVSKGSDATVTRLKGRVVQEKRAADLRAATTMAKKAEDSKPKVESASTSPSPEGTKLPQRVLQSEQFKDFRVSFEKTAGKKDDKEVLDAFYRFQVLEMKAKGIPEKIKTEPLFQQEVAKLRASGINLEPGEIERRALENFLKIQDYRAEGLEPERVPSPTETLPADERIKLLEGKIEKLLEDNKTLSETLQVVLQELSKKAETQEDKEKWYKLLLKIIAITGYEVVVQAAGRMVPRTN